MRSLLGPLFLAPSLASCTGIGPDTIADQRPDYTEVLSATDKGEVLTNIVRLRYLDTPVS